MGDEKEWEGYLRTLERHVAAKLAGAQDAPADTDFVPGVWFQRGDPADWLGTAGVIANETVHVPGRVEGAAVVADMYKCKNGIVVLVFPGAKVLVDAQFASITPTAGLKATARVKQGDVIGIANELNVLAPIDGHICQVNLENAPGEWLMMIQETPTKKPKRG